MKSCYKNLGEFVSCLEQEDELIRISLPVSSVLEITEWADRMSKLPGGGKAFLFEQVEGSPFPVLINAFGSIKRINLALGSRTLDELADRIVEILEQAPPESLAKKLRLVPKALSWTRYLPRIVKGPAPCQEVVSIGDNVDLSALPILTCWPKDGGPFVTLPVVFTKGLHDGKRNAGMYRMQVYDRNTTGMHWHIHKDGSHHYAEYEKAGRRMEVAVAVGTDPAVTYAATAPMPRGVDEMILAGFIRQAPVKMVKGVTVDIEVPAEAEFILEGYVDPGELRREGPFGDHTGYYSLEDDYPVFHVTAVTHRKNPIYSATVVGRPPMEDCYLALATERLFLPMLRTVVPEIVDYHMPWEGVFHNIVVVVIDKEYPLHARKVMSGLWGMGQMSFSKALVIIDDCSLLHNGGALMRHLLDTLDLESDLTVSSGILDVLDHSAPQPLFGSKIGMDATRRLPREIPRAAMSSIAALDETTMRNTLQELDSDILAAKKIFGESRNPLILVTVAKSANKNSAFFIEKITRRDGILSQGIFVIYDAGIDLADGSLLLWKAFNNVDPARDIHVAARGVVIDATKKGPADGHTREWPDDLIMPQAVKDMVSSKARRMGIKELTDFLV
ncbi:MAG TPA: menaquinone biosynthesis decarboxylase [Deltaproteobacteria bacterium]|mgnify:CR=1 FL=1|nr:menaquinone biosynthesis decarboxylase [Deltaproteobacteria bacterium]